MPTDAAPKILARNVAAVRRFADPARVAASVTGNPASTRLESGVGNCFPGLECDLRNLERRFLPFLEVDILDSGIRLVGVDTDGIDAARNDGTLSSEEAKAYDDLAAALAAGLAIVVTDLAEPSGILGPLSFDPRTLPVSGVSTGKGRLPSDTWTAVRLLTEGTDVEVRFEISVVGTSVTVKTRRARYLDDNGALSAAFLPGELTQSLCSPWTHDFRDCGCFYWATNHPDIVQPVYPAAGPPADPQPWQAAVPGNGSIGAGCPIRPCRPPATPARANCAITRSTSAGGAAFRRRPARDHRALRRRGRQGRAVFEPRRPPGSAALRRGRRAGRCPGIPVGGLLAQGRRRPHPGRDTRPARRRARDPCGTDAHRHRRDAPHPRGQRRDPGADAGGNLRTGVAGRPRGAPCRSRLVPAGAATRGNAPSDHRLHRDRGALGRRRRSLRRHPGDPGQSAGRSAPGRDPGMVRGDRFRDRGGRGPLPDLPRHPGVARRASRGDLPARRESAAPDPGATGARCAAGQLCRRAGTPPCRLRQGRFEGATEINGARAAMVRPGGLDTLAHAVAQKGFLVAFDDIADPRFAPIDPPPAPPVA